MEAFFLLKTVHILTAAILFGTGIGIAFFFWMGCRDTDDRGTYFASRITVFADWLFTASAGIVQPLTGLLLIRVAGHDPFAPWLLITYGLYALAFICWVPVVILQRGIRDQFAARPGGAAFDQALFERRRRLWFWLGWPAFIALVIVFHLMVAKPT